LYYFNSFILEKNCFGLFPLRSSRPPQPAVRSKLLRRTGTFVLRREDSLNTFRSTLKPFGPETCRRAQVESLKAEGLSTGSLTT